MVPKKEIKNDGGWKRQRVLSNEHDHSFNWNINNHTIHTIEIHDPSDHLMESLFATDDHKSEDLLVCQISLQTQKF